MNESPDTRTVSLAGCSLSWEDVEEQAKKKGITRSKFVQNSLKQYMQRSQWGTFLDGVTFVFITAIFLKVLFL